MLQTTRKAYPTNMKGMSSLNKRRAAIRKGLNMVTKQYTADGSKLLTLAIFPVPKKAKYQKISFNTSLVHVQ